MKKITKPIIGSGFLAAFSTGWGAYSNLTVAESLPGDASAFAKMLADPPIYLPWLIAALALIALTWLLSQAENSNDPKPGAMVTYGQGSHIFGGDFHGPVTFNGPDSLESQASEIDVYDGWKGCTVVIVLSVQDIRAGSRRMIFEASTKQKGKIAFFISVNNTFVLSVTDVKGETYTVDLPQAYEGVPLGVKWTIILQFGFKGSVSIIRSFNENGVIVAKQFTFKIDVGALDWNITLGSNNLETDNAWIDLYAAVIINGVINKIDRYSIAATLRSRIIDNEQAIPMSFKSGHSMSTQPKGY